MIQARESRVSTPRKLLTAREIESVFAETSTLAGLSSTVSFSARSRSGLLHERTRMAKRDYCAISSTSGRRA